MHPRFNCVPESGNGRWPLDSLLFQADTRPPSAGTQPFVKLQLLHRQTLGTFDPALRRLLHPEISMAQERFRIHEQGLECGEPQTGLG